VAAVENGHDEVATWLLDAGASINQEDPKVTDAIALKGLSQTLDWLEKTGALYWAARWGHELMVKTLLNRGTDVDSVDNGGWTPLYWAASHGH
jgi:hypothetical protein